MKIEIEDVPVKEIMPGFHGRLIHIKNSTLSFWDVEKGAELPEHSHFHEQTTQVLEGKFELILEGEKLICEPGAVVIIPPDAKHSGRAITACKLLDTFSPVREDYK